MLTWMWNWIWPRHMTEFRGYSQPKWWEDFVSLKWFFIWYGGLCPTTCIQFWLMVGNLFFRSSRRLRQRDPLSHTLLIIASEVLSITYMGMHILRDIIFQSGVLILIIYLSRWYHPFFFTWERSLVIKIIRVLKEYASTSGKMINKYKRCFYLHEKHFLLWKIRLRRFAGIRQRTFPFLHLGCPIFYGRSISRYFEDLIRKVSMIIFSWHNISLSFGGNYVHVNHVLNSMLVYLLSTMNPTKKVMD